MIKYKTLFISDLHLGSSHSNAEAFLNFIRNVECEKMYLCGDIFDFHVIKTSFLWSETFNTVIQKLLRKARHGTNIIYIPGNHDYQLRKFHRYKFGNIEIYTSHIHLVDGKTPIKIMHGDEFDTFYHQKKILYAIGSAIYSFALFIDKQFRKLNSKASFSFFFKRKVKSFFEKITNYHQNILNHAHSEGVEGVISGHTHLPGLSLKDSVIIGNCGCWMADTINTCIAENYEGQLCLLTIDSNGSIINEKTIDCK